MELSDLLDSDTLECCEHMTDENTSKGDQSLDNLLLAAYDSISEPLEATLGDEHGSEASERTPGPLTTTDSTPCACANAPNQPHPSPPENKVYYGASQVLYGKSITSSRPIRLCDSNELCTKVQQ